jgi:hypothetical protein
VLVGYLANLAFPRLGEISRCALLKNTDQVPISTSLGTVITERLIDAITLFSLLGFSFIIEYDLIFRFFENIFVEYDIDQKKIVIALVSLFLLAAIVLMIFIKGKGALIDKVKSFLREIYQGLISIRKLQNPVGFLVSSVLIWVIYYFMSYLIVFSLPETAWLRPSAGFLLLVTGGIALALPVQGGIGTFHTMVTGLLLLYGIDKTTGLFMATLLHTSQVFAIAFFGGIALLLSLAIKKKKASESHQT